MIGPAHKLVGLNTFRVHQQPRMRIHLKGQVDGCRNTKFWISYRARIRSNIRASRHILVSGSNLDFEIVRKYSNANRWIKGANLLAPRLAPALKLPRRSDLKVVGTVTLAHLFFFRAPSFIDSSTARDRRSFLYFARPASDVLIRCNIEKLRRLVNIV